LFLCSFARKNNNLAFFKNLKILFKKVSSLASELLEVEDFYLDQTDRGERGFGSTGTN